MNGDALQRLVRHLEHFQRHISFPGKGFMFLDWLHKTIAATSPVALPIEDMSAGDGLENKAQAEGVESAQSAQMQAVKTLYPNEVSEAFSRYSGLPVELISDAYTADAAHITKRLKAKVIGQDAACLAASEILARFKAGLNDPERPCGSLLFVGPTGVGKTELAKQVAAYMFGSPERMIRLDMSEYMGYGSAQRLLTPSRGQSLVERMRQQPLSLVLLDEIEKAHPEVFDLLLGVLGEGRLTDTEGQLADFRMGLIILTSNLGVQEGPPPSFHGMAVGQGGDERFTRAVRQHFRPEFFNRLDRVISFRTLRPQDVSEIVDLEVASLQRRVGFERRQVKVSISERVRGWLAVSGYHPTRGARPLKRLIEAHVMSPLAVLLAEQPGLSRCEVRVVGVGEAVAAGSAKVRILAIETPENVHAV